MKSNVPEVKSAMGDAEDTTSSVEDEDVCSGSALTGGVWKSIVLPVSNSIN